MVAVSSGSLGDIVYSVVLMKRMGVKTLYVKESKFFPPYGNMYSEIKDLIEVQGIECKPTRGDLPMHVFEAGLRYEVDLDKARYEKNRGRNHIIISYLNSYNVRHGE